METRIYPEKAPSISTKMVSRPTYRMANHTQQLGVGGERGVGEGRGGGGEGEGVGGGGEGRG